MLEEHLACKRWEPKKWRVDHEIVILMHVSGKSNKDIALLNDKTEVWVSLVINCRQGKDVIARIRANLPTNDLGDKYRKIVELSADRTIRYLEDEVTFGKAPGAVVDRAIRAIGLLDPNVNKSSTSTHTIEKTTERTLVLTSEANTHKILQALERTQRVTELHRIGTGTDG